MDKISESLLKEFSQRHEITELDESERFEHFASDITMSRHYKGTINAAELVVGADGTVGIDGIAYRR